MDEQGELPVLPYADRRAGKSSGWSGSDTSQERAERDDASGETTKRQKYILRVMGDRKGTGLTWKELADVAGWHHGQASGALSNMHQGGLIERLAERRNRCHPYVLPEYVGDREVQPFGGKKRPSLADAWDEGHQRGLRDADLQHVADNPYRKGQT